MKDSFTDEELEDVAEKIYQSISADMSSKDEARIKSCKDFCKAMEYFYHKDKKYLKEIEENK